MGNATSLGKKIWNCWPLAICFLGVGVFSWHYFIHVPLPFFGYFSDPEVAYIFSALQLNESGYVQMTDHPGTFLQVVGAVIARLSEYNIMTHSTLFSIMVFVSCGYYSRVSPLV